MKFFNSCIIYLKKHIGFICETQQYMFSRSQECGNCIGIPNNNNSQACQYSQRHFQHTEREINEDRNVDRCWNLMRLKISMEFFFCNFLNRKTHQMKWRTWCLISFWIFQIANGDATLAITYFTSVGLQTLPIFLSKVPSNDPYLHSLR